MLNSIKDFLDEIEALEELEYDLLEEDRMEEFYEVGMEIRSRQAELIDRLLEQNQKVKPVDKKILH